MRCGVHFDVPFLSSMVTVSFWHFMRNLCESRQPESRGTRLAVKKLSCCFCACAARLEGAAYLTSFMVKM